MPKFSSLAVAVAATLSVATANANLLTNGTFEADASDITSGNQRTVYANETTISGWTVDTGNVDLVKPNHTSISNIAIDLIGLSAGAISQSFAAKAGYTYQLTFDRRKNGPADMTVNFGGLAPVVFASLANNGIKSESLSWKATADGSALVKFTSGVSLGGNGRGGSLIDNVAVIVTSVPEPGTYVMLLAGLAAVGFIAKRRSA